MNQDTWESLPEGEKIPQIIEALLLNEMGAVDPVFTNRYIDVKARTEDMADRMRLDLQYWERVNQLRQEGKVGTVEELRRQAEEMVNLSSEDMRAAMMERHREARRRGWEHFDGDPTTLVKEGGSWFDGNREVVIVAGDLTVNDPTILTRSMGHFHYLNPEDFQEYDIFLVYKDTFE